MFLHLKAFMVDVSSYLSYIIEKVSDIDVNIIYCVLIYRRLPITLFIFTDFIILKNHYNWQML